MKTLDKKRVKYNKEALVNYMLDYGNEFCSLYMATPEQRKDFINSAINYKVRQLCELSRELPKQTGLSLDLGQAGIKLVVREDYAHILRQYYERQSV